MGHSLKPTLSVSILCIQDIVAVLNIKTENEHESEAIYDVFICIHCTCNCAKHIIIALLPSFEGLCLSVNCTAPGKGGKKAAATKEGKKADVKKGSGKEKEKVQYVYNIIIIY